MKQIFKVVIENKDNIMFSENDIIEALEDILDFKFIDVEKLE